MHEWPQVSLGELLRLERRPVEVLPDKQYAEIGTYSFGRGIFHKEPRSGLEVGDKDLFLIKEGDFILQITFAWEGAVGLASAAEDGMYGSVRFPTFRVDESRCFPKFLVNYFRTPSGLQQLGKISPGSAGRNRVLSIKQIPEVFVPLPPLDEQRRLVARIEALAAKIEEARGLRRLAVEEADLLFYITSRKVRQELLNTQPVEMIGSFTTVTSGGTPDRSNLSYWEDGSIPWIKTGELVDAPIYDSEEKITDLAVSQSSAKLFPIDTVLIALYGQGQTRGRTGLLKIPATTNQACAAILPRPELLDSVYIQYWLRSLYHEMREENHGGAQPNWNGGMIKKIEIALPPLEEQRRIVAYLDGLQAKVDAMKQLQAQTQVELDALLPSVLDQAFKGEL